MEMVQYLVLKGADVNAKCESEKSPMFEALIGGHSKILYFLKQKNGEIHA
jgi:hypothetical protein